jgi:NADP-dependent 3-hydroxy acid dehydrogenase YdfG
MQDMKNLKDKNIWIIGASSGIGKATAEHLVEQGANVAISARSGDKLKDIVDGFDGDNHMALPMDVSKIDDFDTAIQALTKNWDRLDSVIFLPAIYDFHSDARKDLDFIHKAIDVNLKGALTTAEKTIPIFEKQGQGQIVLCGSIAGYRGLPNGQPYCATKAAIINYAESLKLEMEPKNIDVKLISPGFVKTDLTDKNDFEMPFIIETDEAAKRIANGLISKPFEIHFPKRMTYIMKLIQLLPNPLYFMFGRQIVKKMNDD